MSKEFKKYLAVFNLSIAEIFQFKINFLIGRLRNLILLTTLYYLWKTVFGPSQNLFGYSLAAMFTYIIASHLANSVTLLTITTNISSEITGGGQFFSYLLRPVSYLKFWFVSDLAYKITDSVSSIVEIAIFVKVLKIPLILPTNPGIIAATVIAVIFAIVLNFYLGFFVSLMAFWTPQAWGPRFLFDLVLSFAAGSFFPLDIFGAKIVSIFSALPFYYLLFFPINVFLGRVSFLNITTGLLISGCWIVFLAVSTQFVWQKGLKAYEGGGI